MFSIPSTLSTTSLATAAVSAFPPPVQAGGGALPAFSALGTNSLVSVDAMKEFRLQTSSFSREYGRTPGGQISIVTRSGANQFTVLCSNISGTTHRIDW